MVSLPINLDKFGFVNREKVKSGNKIQVLKNRCGRDFFYYSLTYYLPETFNKDTLNPIEIENKKLFGTPMPAWLVWTCLPFIKIPKLFNKYGLKIEVNNKPIKSFPSFIFKSILWPERLPADEAISLARNSVDKGIVSGIDVSIALKGLVDHVMFVYGYDDENLYVFDTHQVGGLEYEKITPDDDYRYVMKLPFSVIRKRWYRVNRVWVVKK
jgi:hypothetical protein